MSIKRCLKCLMPDTRPRIELIDGVCNACLWYEKKKEIDWNKRWDELKRICNQYRRNDGRWDVIVPASGGKDSSTIAHRLKHELNMHPLTVTLAHPLPTRMGWTNWNNFVQTGFDNILITPDMGAYRKYARNAFIDRGMPKQPFVVAISSAIIKFAKRFDINLIMFAENGEMEYSGSSKYIEKFTRDFLVNIYYESDSTCEKYGPWWEIPSDEDLEDLYVTHFSNFTNWDPEDHAKYAKQNLGMELMVGGNISTFTSYAQNEDKIQDLHMFLAYCKFSIGRCLADTCIEIRYGRMTREQGIEVVNRLDGQYPVEFHQAYLDYFDLSEEQFWNTIDRHVNKDILVPTGSFERPYILKERIR